MALQGTLDTFALPDVLRLLAATRKTGRLDLDGDRGHGAAWLDAGDVVAVDVGSGTTDLAEATFELLRFREGSFTFTVDATTDGGPGVPVEQLVGEAESLLQAWADIEAVVPSTSSWVRLVPELAAPSVTLDRDAWEAVARIGAGTTVAEVGQRLGLGELGVSRAVAGLVELGVVELGEAPPVPAPPAPPAEPVSAPAPPDQHAAQVTEDEPVLEAATAARGWGDEPWLDGSWADPAVEAGPNGAGIDQAGEPAADERWAGDTATGARLDGAVDAGATGSEAVQEEHSAPAPAPQPPGWQEPRVLQPLPVRRPSDVAADAPLPDVDPAVAAAVSGLRDSGEDERGEPATEDRGRLLKFLGSVK